MNERIPYSITGGLSPEIEDFFRLREAIARCFVIDSFHISGETIRFNFSTMNLDPSTVKRIFRELGYVVYIKKRDARNICILRRTRDRAGEAARKENLTAAILLIVCFITTTAAGYQYSYSMVTLGLMKNAWPGALGFSLALLLILGSHEMAHKLAARRNGIDATPPYFIPFPSLFGTMGAVIKVKSPTPDRNAAVALGISGPLAGFIMTIPFLIIGLKLSPVVPDLPSKIEQAGGSLMFFGEPLALRAAYLLLGIRDSSDIYLHPFAFAAWAGLLVTGLNLIPIAQLDGGHISHALAGRRAHSAASFFLSGLLILAGGLNMLATFFPLGVLGPAILRHVWPGWLIWGVFGLLISRRGYPPTLSESEPLSPLSWLLGAVGLLLLILCFIPNPIGFEPPPGTV